MRRAHRALYRGEEFVGDLRARGHHLEDLRGRAVLLHPARALAGGGGRPCRQRLRQGCAAAAPDGVCGRSAETDLDLARGIGWISPNLAAWRLTEQDDATTRSQESAGACRGS